MDGKSQAIVETVKNAVLSGIFWLFPIAIICTPLPLFLFGQASPLNYDLKPVFSSRHFCGIEKVFFASDGKRLISSGCFKDKIVRIWDVETGKELSKIESDEPIELVTYSAATDTVAAVVGDEIVLWDVETGKKTQTFTIKRPGATEKTIIRVDDDGSETKEIDKFESSMVDSFLFSPDGKTLSVENDDGILLWDIKNKRILRKVDNLSKLDAQVHIIGFSPDSSEIYLLQDSEVYVQNVKSGKTIRSFGTDIVISDGISPQGNVIVSGASGSTDEIYFWDAKTGKVLKTLNPPNLVGYRCIAFSPDETLLAACEGGGTVKLFDAQNLREIKDLGKQSENSTKSVFSPDGKVLLTNDGGQNLRLWDTKTGKLIKTVGKLANDVISVDLDSKSERLAILSNDEKPIVFNLAAPDIAKSFGGDLEHSPSTLRFSLVGNLLFFAGTIIPEDRDVDTTDIITVLDRAKNLKISNLIVGRQVISMDISANGSIAAAANIDREVKIWETKTGKMKHQIKYAEERIPYYSEMPLALSPDGTWLAVNGAGYTKLLVLNTETGETFTFENEKLTKSLKFAPDNRTLAALEDEDSGQYDVIVLYDVVSRKLTRKLEEDRKESSALSSVFSEQDEDNPPKPIELSFSPDGELFALAAGGSDITIWNTATGKQVKYQTLPSWLNFRGSFILANINDRKILIEITDGHIVFSDANTKKALANLYVYGEKDWGMSAPDGRFDATEGALKFIHFTDGKRIVAGNAFKSDKFTKGLLQEVLGY